MLAWRRDWDKTSEEIIAMFDIGNVANCEIVPLFII